ncbi:SDR family oxidoreductase [Bacteroidota bacterium]
MDLKIKGKVAVVTASSKGLGKSVAEALAKEGVNLAICSRNRKSLITTADNIRKTYKVEVLPITCDVSNPNEIVKLKETVLDKFKACHILFTNAGGPPSGKIEDFSSEDFQSALELNLMSTINLVKSFLPVMKSQKWGRIIALTSSNVKQLLHGFPLSNVSRLSVVAFIKSVAMEFAQFNITANVIAPGDFMTELTENYLVKQSKNEGISYDTALEQLKNSIPAKMIGNPSDLGALAAFLSSEYTSYLTGETILIDGGKYCGVL